MSWIVCNSLSFAPCGGAEASREFVDAQLAGARSACSGAPSPFHRGDVMTSSSAAPVSSTPRLAAAAVDEIRVPIERELAEALASHPVFNDVKSQLAPPPPEAVRRRLIGRSLRLTEGMAPDAYASARAVQDALGVTRAIEIYQSSGRENAAIHLVEEPILLEVQGRLLSLLDKGSSMAVFGHELGHYLAHGPWTPLGQAGVFARALASSERAPEELVRLGSTLSMAQELTADRFGLLACRDLEAVLRLEMISTTGLPCDALTWDTKAYLEQCRELMEQCLRDGEAIQGSTHPEHNLRAWAAWLFSESDLYRELTGNGPGTRSLAEINALVAKVLRRPDVDTTFHIYDAPPPQLHELALACSVLVALADGELADAEAEALERVFAPLVPDWRWYLNEENARTRFSEVAHVIAALGPDAHRALFHLLTHMLGADNVADSRELAMISAIGDALGCGPLFESLLGPVLRRFGYEHVDAPAPSISVTLPPRKGEAEDALRSFLGGYARRGGGETTVRRLLRVVGLKERTPESIARLDAALKSNGLTVAQSLSDIGLDDALVLTSTRVAADTSAPKATKAAADATPEKARLLRAIGRLRDELVSGDGHSPAIRVHAIRSGRTFDLATLDAISLGLSERCLAKVREGKSAALITAEESGQLESAHQIENELRLLWREDRARTEETGARDLFLGTPFITGVVGGYLVRGPLILHPVALDCDVRGARGYSLVPGDSDPAIVNQALVTLLFNKKGFSLSEDLVAQLNSVAADPEGGAVGVLALLKELGLPTVSLTGELKALKDRRIEYTTWGTTRLEVEECAVLGLYPQSSSDLLRDYDALLSDLEKDGADLPGLLACARELLPEELRAVFPAPPLPASTSGVRPVVPIIHADPSQRRVIELSRTTRALVVDGPPGTGKSQVIVNLVADAIGRGERVAVVSEKRAALDVVANRLDAVGLRASSALVHDVLEDRKVLYEQITKRLETTDLRAHDSALLMAVQRELEQVTGILDERSSQLEVRGDGRALTVGQLYALDAGIDAPSLEPFDFLGKTDELAVLRLIDALGPLHANGDLLRPDSIWRRSAGGRRQGFANHDAGALRQVTQQLELARQTATKLEAERARSPISAEVVEQNERALQTARDASVALAETDELLFRPVLLAAVSDPGGLDELSTVSGVWAESEDALRRIGTRVRLSAPPGLETAMTFLFTFAGRFARFFSPGWWRARSFFRQALSTVWPERAAEPISRELVLDVRTRVRASGAWTALDTVSERLGIRGLLPASVAAASELIAKAGDVAPTARRLAGVRRQLEAAHGWPAEGAGIEAWAGNVQDRLTLLAIHRAHVAAVKVIRAVFPWLGALASSEQIAELLNAWNRDGARVAEMDRQLAVATQITPDATAVATELATRFGEKPLVIWRDIVLKSWARASICSGSNGRAVSTLAAGQEDVLGVRLAELHERATLLEQQRLFARLDEAPLLRTPTPLKGARRNPAQALREGILKEAQKQRSVMPLRTFVRSFASKGLLDILPIWMLSPETMTVLFPREPLFDLVIFDEASQCTVESGLPVLLRARRVVIAGDEKQMPPTSFFSAARVSEDDDLCTEAAKAGDMLQAESLLTLARMRVEHVGLEWHYRCREEELIAFSNHSMYAGNLLTIPSVVTRDVAPAMRWVSVPDGQYDAGRNPNEARRVIDEVYELLGRTPAPSIGMVTFNLQQRQALLDEVDRRRGEDLEFARRFGEAESRERLDERPFVKNLENVQGDERDVIVFSLGHAPVERVTKNKGVERYVPSRFGPLGLAGGERRLNVAISRAKAECVIVASFEPSMLSVARTKNEGPKLFKYFLEFAHHMSATRRAQAERVLALVGEQGSFIRGAGPQVPFAAYIPLKGQIASALLERGIRCELDVGTSRFRVPLAVIDPTSPGRYALGIVCEEGLESMPSFERHAQRPKALGSRGWKLLRITARDWSENRERELAKVLAAVPASERTLAPAAA